MWYKKSTLSHIALKDVPVFVALLSKVVIVDSAAVILNRRALTRMIKITDYCINTYYVFTPEDIVILLIITKVPMQVPSSWQILSASQEP